jgi:hypothetical protein
MSIDLHEVSVPWASFGATGINFNFNLKWNLLCRDQWYLILKETNFCRFLIPWIPWKVTKIKVHAAKVRYYLQQNCEFISRTGWTPIHDIYTSVLLIVQYDRKLWMRKHMSQLSEAEVSIQLVYGVRCQELWSPGLPMWRIPWGEAAAQSHVNTSSNPRRKQKCWTLSPFLLTTSSLTFRK